MRKLKTKVLPCLYPFLYMFYEFLVKSYFRYMPTSMYAILIIGEENKKYRIFC